MKLLTASSILTIVLLLYLGCSGNLDNTGASVLSSQSTNNSITSVQNCETFPCIDQTCATEIASSGCPEAGGGMTSCLNKYKTNNPSFNISGSCKEIIWNFFLPTQSAGTTEGKYPAIFADSCTTNACLDQSCSAEIAATGCPDAGGGLAACLNTYVMNNPSYYVSESCAADFWSFYILTESAATIEGDLPYLYNMATSALPVTGP